MGILGFAYSMVLVKLLPRRPIVSKTASSHPTPIAFRDVMKLIRIPSVLALAAAFSCASIVNLIILSYLPLFIHERYHLSLAKAAFDATVYFQAAAMTLTPIYTAFSDRWTMSDTRHRYLAAAACAVLGIPALAVVGYSHNRIVMVAALVCFSLAFLGSDISWLSMLCNVTSPRQRATGYSILNFSGTLMGGSRRSPPRPTCTRLAWGRSSACSVPSSCCLPLYLFTADTLCSNTIE